MTADALHRLLGTGKSQRIESPLISSFERVPLPRWNGQPQTVAVIWRLTKDTGIAECQLVTQPLGAEIRVAAAEQDRSEARRASRQSHGMEAAVREERVAV